MKPKRTWNFRGKLSKESRDAVRQIRAKHMIAKNEVISQDEIIDAIIRLFEQNKFKKVI